MKNNPSTIISPNDLHPLLSNYSSEDIIAFGLQGLVVIDSEFAADVRLQESGADYFPRLSGWASLRNSMINHCFPARGEVILNHFDIKILTQKCRNLFPIEREMSLVKVCIEEETLALLFVPEASDKVLLKQVNDTFGGHLQNHHYKIGGLYDQHLEDIKNVLNGLRLRFIVLATSEQSAMRIATIIRMSI